MAQKTVDFVIKKIGDLSQLCEFTRPGMSHEKIPMFAASISINHHHYKYGYYTVYI